MGRLMRSCIQSVLKLLNSVIAMVGLGMILYAVWLIRVWQREMGDLPFDDSENLAPWFIYTSLGLGVALCIITCLGHVAAETANGCCLYLGLSFLLALILKAVGPHQYYDSDDEYASDRVPLLNNAAMPPPYVVGNPIVGSKNDAWSIRINEKVNLAKR